MFSKTAVHSIALALLKRAEANEVEWRIDGDEYSVELPAFVVGLSRNDTDRDKAIAFEIRTPQGESVGKSRVTSDEPQYNELSQLLRSAETFSQTWDERLIEAAKSISAMSGRIGSTRASQGGVTFLTPPLPTRPTEEQTIEFFRKIEGQWELRFERPGADEGVELLDIDRVGNYFTHTSQRGKPIGRTVFPRYRIVLLFCDAEMKHIEISKQEFNGRQRQIEVLTISESAMDGYAKHDEHALHYRRR